MSAKREMLVKPKKCKNFPWIFQNSHQHLNGWSKSLRFIRFLHVKFPWNLRKKLLFGLRYLTWVENKIKIEWVETWKLNRVTISSNLYQMFWFRWKVDILMECDSAGIFCVKLLKRYEKKTWCWNSCHISSRHPKIISTVGIVKYKCIAILIQWIYRWIVDVNKKNKLFEYGFE